MAQLPNEVEHDAEVVSHRWVELGRGAKLALQVEYKVGAETYSGLIWFTEAARNMGRRALAGLGFDITAKDPSELDAEPPVLAGKKCKVRLAPYSHNGKTEMKADLVIPRDVPVGRGSLKALGQSFASGSPAPQKQKAEKEPAPKSGGFGGDVNFDDIPF